MYVDRPRLNMGTAMAWCFDEFEIEIETNDVSFVRMSKGAVEIEAIFHVHLVGRVAVLSRLDIQGTGANTLGLGTRRNLAWSVMEMLDVYELRIEGAARPSGAGPGHRPAPLRFPVSC